jgi:hypothetical protein
MTHTLLSQLLKVMPATPAASAIPSARARPRNRLSKFQPHREEILRLHVHGKSLNFILRSLTRRSGDTSLPTSKSQLSRFIARCYAT